MFQLLQSLWRGGCIVFIVYHKGPTWRGCRLVTNLAILQNFRTPVALSWPKGCSSARFSLWLQHHPFFGGVCPHWDWPVHPSNRPETGRQQAQGSGLWLGFPPSLCTPRDAGGERHQWPCVCGQGLQLVQVCENQDEGQRGGVPGQPVQYSCTWVLCIYPGCLLSCSHLTSLLDASSLTEMNNLTLCGWYSLCYMN